MSFLASLEGSAIAVLIRETMWTYPGIISVHAIGMAIVVGIGLVFALRALGLGGRIPISSMDPLLKLAWIGVGLNVCSGLLLFIADARKFLTMPTFQIKLALLVAATIVFVMLVRRLEANRSGNDKALAMISLVLWLGAITAGRLTAYIK
ncbi:MAG: hypothetical protein IT494_09860 [Gammaproteobacteria bacterium]|nr:hypothetical protein [Gammaproteobacteria bacterium]